MKTVFIGGGAGCRDVLELYDREPRPVLELMRTMANSEDEGIRSAAAAGKRSNQSARGNSRRRHSSSSGIFLPSGFPAR